MFSADGSSDMDFCIWSSKSIGAGC